RRVGARDGGGGGARHAHAGAAADVAENLGVHRASRAQHDDALDAVFQLADVAGPVVVHEHAHGVGRDIHRATVLHVELLEEEVDESRDLLTALAERRVEDLDDVQKINEVFHELMYVNGEI